MGSTNKTNHYELPQFVANDKPSWLGDVNEAMEAIDTAIYSAKSSADGAQTTANNAVAGVQTANTRMDGMQTQLDTVATQANQTATTVAGHTSAIATNSANINTLNSRMGSTDISAIGDGTVTGAINAIAQGGGGGGTGTLIATVTGDGAKTAAQLLNELFTALNGRNLSMNAKIDLSNAGNHNYYTMVQKGAGVYTFTTPLVTTTDFDIQKITLENNNSSMYKANRASTQSSGGNVLASGYSISIYD